MGMGGQRHASVALPRELPCTHCTVGRCGRVRKISLTPGFGPRTFQPLLSRGTD